MINAIWAARKLPFLQHMTPGCEDTVILGPLCGHAHSS